MIKHIQAHVYSCTWCRRERMQADKYHLQTMEISKGTFTKVSIDLTVELPTSHYGNKNIFLKADHLTEWSIAKAIPDKEATTMANAIFKKLVPEHGAVEILCLSMAKT